MTVFTRPNTAVPETGPASSSYGQPQRRRIGEVLVAEGVISGDQLEEALGRRLTDGMPRERLGQTIVRLGMATDVDIARALAVQLGIESLDSDPLPVDPAVASSVPAAIAERHSVLPMAWEEGGVLVLACTDPTDVVAMDDVRLAAGAKQVRAVVVAESALGQAMRKAFGFDQRAGDLLDAFETDEPDELSADELARVADDAPIVRLAEGVLRDAIDADASDIHVEPGSSGTVVRYRTDGVLKAVTTVPRNATGPLLSRLKLMAGMDIAERRRPQDGRMRVRGVGVEVDFRASTLPSMFGETMVLRLLRKGDERLAVGDIGLDEIQLAQAMAAIERPQGLILITGPTGSGKTSTLYAFLSHLASETHNVITLEDPVEYQLDGINQTQIHEQIGLTFAKCLRTVLRQDPDIVMVGEVRDPETAELALQASLTGHLVFSTLHTNDAPGAVVRLHDLSIPSYLVSSALTMVIAQRLVRTICPRCVTTAEPTERQIAQLHLSTRDVESGTFRAGAGCGYCGHTGYKGRLGLFEVLMVDGRIRDLLSAGAGEGALRQAARIAGMGTLREDGIAKAREGITTLEEIMRVTPTDVVVQGTCPTCSGDVEPDFDHCPWCGANLRPDACARCERELHFGWKICPGCGTPCDGERDRDGDRLPVVTVVDDDASVRKALEAMLHGDYDVVSCANGTKALEAVAERRPDVVLADVTMPGLDGYELTRQLRARPVTMHVPIMLITGSDERDAELEGLRAGADDFLAKPLDPDVLTARIDALLRRATV